MIAVALAWVAGAAELDLPVAAWCDGADLVAVAEVTSSETAWTDAPGGGIETRYWLAVGPIVKGDKVDTIEVVLPGGTLGDVSLWVSDLPELGVDRTYVVLLARVDGAWQPAVGSRSAIAVARHDKERLPKAADVIAKLGPCR